MTLKETIIVYKKIGETPLEALGAWKEVHPEYADVPMTYAGRLDPMAEGLLLLLAGEECKKKDDYLALPKEYVGEILLGISTDTGDVLGLINSTDLETGRIEHGELEGVAEKMRGKQKQEYPAYSSKTVDGKPLWKSAREGEEVEKPMREIEIYELEVTGIKQTNFFEVLMKIESSISKVKGDFRQKEIIKTWRELKIEADEVQIVSFKCRVSSGTYVRVLAEKLGRGLDVPACLLSLKRTRIGDFDVEKEKGE